MPTSDVVWCEACLSYFAPVPRCQQCGLTTLIPVDKCGACLNHPPPWDRLICVGEYQRPLKPLIHQFKYQRKFWLAYDLAQLLAKHIEEPAPMLAPVPLHWRRALFRSFNQSELIAKHLATALEVDMKPNLFCRIKATQMQQGLDRVARKKNLLAAFKLNPTQLPEHIAIVDDVVTTGSTVTILTKLLKKAGVKRVDIYCICRTAESVYPLI
ncbi:ComF family protein [Aliivibrio sp.]|uniref:ComF family protein n=1 Tax=Aliivibrio sp. TaxID=1872443 RepID=UPI003D2F25EE